MSSASPEHIVAWLTGGDPSRLTGGNLYNRRMIDALRRAGVAVTEFGRSRDASLGSFESAAARAATVVVDSIAIENAPRLLGDPGRPPWRTLALLHMLPSEYAPRRQRKALRLVEQAFLPSVDRTVAVSECVRDQAVAAGADPRSVRVIPPGRDGTRAANISLERAARSTTGRTRAICVANWEARKGIHTLVTALARTPSVSLDLVGDTGSGRYARWIYALIDRHGIAARVRVHGPRAGGDLAALYAASDFFVLPSYIETYGIAYAEALSCGLPVIGCRIGILPWLVEEGCGLLIRPGDAGDLAEAMERLSRDPSLRVRMSHQALERAARLPTWPQSEVAFVEVVRGLLGPNP